MAGWRGAVTIEWRCLKPEFYGEEHGFASWVAIGLNEAKEEFLKLNPDYEVINVTLESTINDKGEKE